MRRHTPQFLFLLFANRRFLLVFFLLLILFGTIAVFTFNNVQSQQVKHQSTQPQQPQQPQQTKHHSTQPQQTQQQVHFVTRNGQQLVLNGKSFRFFGVNRYNLLTTDSPALGCGEAWSRQDLEAYFAEMHALHITAIRFFAFQSFTAGGKDFSRLDYLLSLSKKYDIFLIPILENQWPSCTQGDYKFDSWYRSDYLSPYGNYRLSYKNYVHLIVTRYKDNPSILMWQLMNEAESQSTTNVSDPEAFYNFASNMSAYIKSIDPNHLVNLGTIGSNQPGMEGINYRILYSISSIDILEVHDYDQETTALPAFIAQDIRIAKVLNKPIFVGEAGMRTGCTQPDCFSVQERAVLFRAKMNAFFEQNGVGYLIWSYRDNSPPSDVWDFDVHDPLAQVASKISAALHSVSTALAPRVNG